MHRTGRVVAAVALIAVAAAAPGAEAASLQPIGSYDRPMYVTSDPGNPERLFVAERAGIVKLTTPAGTSTFLDIAQPVRLEGERGLFSIAFPPDFATTALFYVAYASGPAADAGALVLDEYRAYGDVADPTSRREVLRIPTGAAVNHNGGQLQFGPDGYLYWSIGDATNLATPQDPNDLHGKLLRIDPRAGGAGAYSVPADNPFAQAGGRPEIWSLGLRNPWRFSFDRGTGAVVIADVGANQREEVNYVSPAAGGGRGANFGWPTCEGTIGPPDCAGGGGFTPPVFEYNHAPDTPGPESCSITGGYVVRDPGVSELLGRYLFADFCGGDLRSIDPLAPPAVDGYRAEQLSAGGPVSFGEDSCGRLYLASREPDPGQVSRIVGSSPTVCSQPSVADGSPPETELSLKPRNKRRSRVRAKFSSDEAGSTFECRLDRADWAPCTSPRRLRGLDPGRHRFRVRATDPAGNVDPSPAKKRVRTYFKKPS